MIGAFLPRLVALLHQTQMEAAQKAAAQQQPPQAPPMPPQMQGMQR
jgi:hypothetical protein